ncbi:hypothetical protein SADUNF_Sadunf07G0003400 [Salix dunnii]|uniref:non-specific serine/threonine protein kinase n=1 Tax=Salix dunnii TaxID=1413687 RepID=A0A835K3X4_9ROSI|nr:hypothetical protein SADUNF_Sadunf07G0003400 [Salix dunnii]
MSRHVYLSFLLPLLVLPSTASVYFQTPQFNGTNMNYQGDAVPFGSYIEFNLVNYINRVGWATYPERVRLWDSTSGQISDFTSHFSFTIDTTFDVPTHGHGLSFFLAPVGFQIPPNSAGGFLGLFNTTTMQSSLNQIVTVEFDSYSNDGWDPKVEHVGININNIRSAVYTPWNASFHSGDIAEAWITYNSTGRNLSVFWNYQTTSDPRENSSLFYIIDLNKFLPEWVTVGFSAATGSNVERHRLLSWEFNSSLSVTEKRGKSSKKTMIIIGVNVPVFILIAGSITAYVILWRRKQRMTRKRAAEKMTSINEDLERGAGLRRFSYDDLVSATNNFSDQRKLGEEGFGAVYRGYLNDMNMEIAVKKISGSSRQGKKEYITEVKTISQISLGLASGLLYLHEEWEQCVVHRDVKSSNIMLDSSFNVKLDDFGLARLMDHDEPGPKTTGLAGTFGYMAPEYISTRRASKESDVYSFGMVALEIATGRRANDSIDENSEMSLVEWIWDLYGCGNLGLAVDKKLDISDNDDKKQAECLMIVGLWCAHPDHNLRPSIKQAIQVLNFEAAMPDLPQKMPVLVFHVPQPSFTSSEPGSITNTSLEAGGLSTLFLHVNSFSFKFTSFSPNMANISFQGDAFSSNDVLQLTKNAKDVSLTGSAGRATYNKHVRLWDAKTRKLTDFTTHFTFVMKAVDLGWYGDGMSFFIAPLDSPIPQDSSGGFLALFSPRNAFSASKENQIVAVEFDSKKDKWDPSDDHIGIDVNSVVSVASVDWKSSIKTGSKANAWVSYNSTTKNLSVFLTYAKNPEISGNSRLYYIIDLREFLPEWVRIGFSASTGDWVEIHNILSWSFESSLEVSDKKKTGLAAGLAVGTGVLTTCGIGVLCFVLCWRKIRRCCEKVNETIDVSMDDEFERGTGPKRFTYRESGCGTSTAKGKFLMLLTRCCVQISMSGRWSVLMIVGLWCCHPDYTLRPSIRQVINVPNFESPLPTLPSKLPVPMYYAPPMSMCKFSYTSSGITADSESHRTDQCSCSSCSTSMVSSGSTKALLNTQKSDI